MRRHIDELAFGKYDYKLLEKQLEYGLAGIGTEIFLIYIGKAKTDEMKD